VTSLVGTELTNDEDRLGDGYEYQTFSDSFVNEGVHRESPAQDGIGHRGVSAALVASMTVPVDEIAGILFPHAHQVILTEPRQPRAISVPLLSEMTAHLASHRPTIIRDPFQALDHALKLARENDAVFVTGSLYLVGDLRTYWRNRRLATPVRS